MTEAVTDRLVQVVQPSHDGLVLCRDHLRQIFDGAVVAHKELPAHLSAFWGYRCMMCGVLPVADRFCESESCQAPLHPQWPAVYCCNDCALDDV